jgi:hypothetical protein
MLTIGCDYHPSFQQIALVDNETDEVQERRLMHREEAEQFYRNLATAGAKVRVGMEASGHAGWFERLLAELNFELWMGDAAKIAAKRRGRKIAKVAMARRLGIRLYRNHDRVCDRRDGWVGLSSAPETIASEPWSITALVQRERNGALLGVHGLVRSKRT